VAILVRQGKCADVDVGTREAGKKLDGQSPELRAMEDHILQVQLRRNNT
jgi:hypothetical protein